MGTRRAKRHGSPGGDPGHKLITTWQKWASLLEQNLQTFAFGAYSHLSPAQRVACRDVLQRLHEASQAYLEVLDGSDVARKEEKAEGDLFTEAH